MRQRKPISGPPEFFLELYSLFRALEKEKRTRGLVYEVQDAMARVLSHLRNIDDQDVQSVVRAILADHSAEESA